MVLQRDLSAMSADRQAQAEETAKFLLRVGIAFAFIYPAVAASIDPMSWIGFIPDFVTEAFPGSDNVLLSIFGITEIFIAIWILTAKKVAVPSIIASVYLLAIFLFNITLLDIVFRDISILLMSLSLLILEKKE